MRRPLCAAGLVVAVSTSGAAKPVEPIGPEIVLAEQYGGVYDAGVAGDDFGNFVVVWRGRPGMQGVHVDPSGALDAPFVPTDDPLARRPHLAMRPAGDFVVAWWSQDAEGQPVPTELSARLFDRMGMPQGSEFQVHGFTALDGYYASSAVGMDDAGNFVVVWDGYDYDSPSDPPSQGVFARRFAATGEPEGDAFLVNTDTDGTQYRPAVAVGPSGGFIVTWTNDVTTPGPDDDIVDVVARGFDASGAALGPDFVANASTDGYQVQSSVGADDAGRFVITWESLHEGEEGVFARRFDPMGAPLAAEFRVDTGKRDLVGLGWPRVALDPSGGCAVAWGQGEILARAYDRGGKKLAGEFQVNTYTPGFQVAARVASSGSGEFFVTWSDYRGLIGRRLGPPRVATELRVTDDADPARRKLVIAPRTQVVTSTLGRRLDPAADGAFLHVYNANGGGDSICLALPGAGWTAKGSDPTDASRFVYLDPMYANGPCAKVVVVNRKVVKAKCRARVHPLAFSLDEPSQGTVAVRLVSGARAYCSVFGPTVEVDEAGAFVATSGLPAGECPPAPAPCP